MTAGLIKTTENCHFQSVWSNACLNCFSVKRYHFSLISLTWGSFNEYPRKDIVILCADTDPVGYDNFFSRLYSYHLWYPCLLYWRGRSILYNAGEYHSFSQFFRRCVAAPRGHLQFLSRLLAGSATTNIALVPAIAATSVWQHCAVSCL